MGVCESDGTREVSQKYNQIVEVELLVTTAVSEKYNQMVELLVAPDVPFA